MTSLGCCPQPPSAGAACRSASSSVGKWWLGRGSAYLDLLDGVHNEGVLQVLHGPLHPVVEGCSPLGVLQVQLVYGFQQFFCPLGVPKGVGVGTCLAVSYPESFPSPQESPDPLASPKRSRSGSTRLTQAERSGCLRGTGAYVECTGYPTLASPGLAPRVCSVE